MQNRQLIPFPTQLTSPGPDSVQKRINEPYHLTQDFERSLVYHLCSTPRVFDALGAHVDKDLFETRSASLLVEACQAYRAMQGRAPTDPRLVIEVLQGFHRSGKNVQVEDIYRAKEYLAQCREEGPLDAQAVTGVMQGVVKRRIQLEIVRTVTDEYGKKKDPLLSTKKLLQKFESVGETHKSLGMMFGSDMIAPLQQMQMAQKLDLGIPELTEPLKGGPRRGTVTAYYGGTGTGKSTFLTQMCVNASWRGYHTAMCTLEVEEELQNARYLSNLSGLPFDQVLEDPTQSLQICQDMYPHMAFFLVKYFKPRKTTMQNVLDWVEQAEEELGVEFSVVAVDYLNKFRYSSRTGQRMQPHEILDEASDDLLHWTRDKKCWTFTGVAPTKEAGRVRMVNKGDDSMMDTGDGGGAHAIEQNLDYLLYATCFETVQDGMVIDEYIRIRCGKARLSKGRFITGEIRPNFAATRLTQDPAHAILVQPPFPVVGGK